MNRELPMESSLWKYINQTYVTEERVKELADFKSSGVNFKIALWNPGTNGVRYLKTLIFNLCASLEPEDWDRLRKINNRNVGDPITVKYDREDVCLDYLQAVLELRFIQNNLEINGSRILEIGAGYGRTCHTIMSNHQVRDYYIVELSNALELSQRYLRAVLDQETYSKLHFVHAEDLGTLAGRNYDLCINVDSLAEMDIEVVRYYLGYIADNSDYFYVKNPVGKYLDKSLDNHAEGAQVVRMALQAGPLTNVIDVHDNLAVETQVNGFLEAYRPAGGWDCLDQSWPPPFSYYWQAIFKKRTARAG